MSTHSRLDQPNLQLWKNDTTDNVVISVFSAWAILVPASLVARGETEKQLASVLNIQGVTKPGTFTAYELFPTKVLYSQQGNYTFKLANAILYNNNTFFRQCARNDILNRVLDNMDFSRYPEESRQEIPTVGWKVCQTRRSRI